MDVPLTSSQQIDLFFRPTSGAPRLVESSGNFATLYSILATGHPCGFNVGIVIKRRDLLCRYGRMRYYNRKIYVDCALD